MKDISIENIADNIRQGKVSFLVGAGISYNSGVPIVGYISDDNIIISGIETHILDKLDFSVKEIKQFSKIPFETFFEVLINNGINIKRFVNIFNAKPSKFHHFLAETSNLIPINIGTTNFDDCIEKAYTERGFEYNIITKEFIELCDRNIWKFHGSIDNIEDLGITIKNITSKKNFNERIKLVNQFISQSDCIIVCGYSCSDIFDLKPAFANYELKKERDIIYISHKNDKTFTPIFEKKAEYAKVDEMFDGYNLSIIECDTNEFIDEITRHLNLNVSEVKTSNYDWERIIDQCIEEFDSFRKYKIKANLYYQIESFQKSIECLEMALRNASDLDQQLACIRSIGWTYYRLDDINDALHHLKQLLKDDNVLSQKFPEHYANIYSHLGVCYTIKEEYETAKEYYYRSKDIAEKFNLTWALGQVLINIGELYKRQRKHNEAIESTFQALNILEDNGYLEHVGICYANLSVIYAKQKEYPKAFEFSKHAIAVAKNLGNTEVLKRRNNILNDIYTKRLFEHFDKLYAQSKLIIDRPRGSVHPRYPQIVYKLDYGYLDGTKSSDNEGIDVWLGTDAEQKLDAIVCTSDLVKKDSEIKLLIGCTPTEKSYIKSFYNEWPQMGGILIERDDSKIK